MRVITQTSYMGCWAVHAQGTACAGYSYMSGRVQMIPSLRTKHKAGDAGLYIIGGQNLLRPPALRQDSTEIIL